MEVFGKVISVDLNVEIQKKDGGSYPGSRLTFRGNDGKVQEQALHANVLKFNPSIKTALSNLNPGEDVVIVKEKKGDFWNVVSIKRADANQSSDGGGSVGSSAKQQTNTAPRSNYETPEERAQRQVLIVRQSSLSSAVSILTVGAKTPPKVEEVLQLADQLVAYVFNKQGQEFVDEIASDDIGLD